VRERVKIALYTYILWNEVITYIQRELRKNRLQVAAEKAGAWFDS